MKKYIIGIDIGGTNTDAVIIDQERRILYSCKITTTRSVEQGVTNAINQILKNSGIQPDALKRVCIGTTHTTNALLERKGLCKVGVIRLSSASGENLPPCSGWPDDLRTTMFVGSYALDGGYHCDGRAIKNLNKEHVVQALKELYAKGMESLAIVGVYAPLNPAQEQQSALWAQETLGADFPITMSHTLGGTGFIARENTTILNAALKKVFHNGFQKIQSSLEAIGIRSPIFIVQNNGTIITESYAQEFPVLTIAAGPTNSFLGASRLMGLSHAVIADIGGTSTDVGIVLDGFTRQTTEGVSIGGVTIQAPVPDVLSIALGGGSYITHENDSGYTIEPRSAARQLQKQAQCFGGTELTLTDAALCLNPQAIPGACRQKVNLSDESAETILLSVEQKIKAFYKKIAGIHKDLPLILVGGGALLCLKSSLATWAHIPEHAAVANAYGAACAEVAGTLDAVVCLDNYEATKKACIEKAYQHARQQGAHENTLRIIECTIVPYSYVPGNLARIKIVTAGPLL